MTKILESISVEVRCAATVKGFAPGTRRLCGIGAVATIVSTVERGDLVLVPIGWSTIVTSGQITLFCPDHRERSKT